MDPGRALSLLDLSILQYTVQMGGLLRPPPWLVMGIDCSALCYHALAATGSCTRLQGWQVLSVPTPTAPSPAGWDEGFSLLSWPSDQDRQPGPLTSFPEHRVNPQGPLFRRGNSGSEKMQESEAVSWSGVGRCWWGWVWGTGGPKLIPRSHWWVTAAHPEESSLHPCPQNPSRAPSNFSHHPHFSRRKQKTLLLEGK